MAAPVEENYLSVYRRFLREFTETINPNDPLPVKVTGYLVDVADLEGEIIDCTLQYLNQKSCPQALATAIACLVLDEMLVTIKEDHELRSQSEGDKEVHYDPLRLMHAVISRVRAVCERCLKEVECWNAEKGTYPSLPPPSPGPPFISTYAIKNHRRRMEDRHVAIEDLHALFRITSPGPVGYYAIFDGHHGHEAAAYSAAQLHGLIVHSEHYPKDPEAALRDAFLRADDIFLKKCASSQKLVSGTTVLVALVRLRESLHVAWLGDSLGILVKSNGKITPLVEPHTAEREDERNRIVAEGGVVLMHFCTWRINGTLAISRAIGDPDCKPHVCAAADVVTYSLDGSEHFLILACDGLWDCVTEEEAATFVYEQLRQDPGSHTELGKALVQLAKSLASNDNISVVVVLLSSVEDILATAPSRIGTPQDLYHQREEESQEAPLVADGLALSGANQDWQHHLLVNSTMEGEAAATAHVSEDFAPCKGLTLQDGSLEDRPSALLDFHAAQNGHGDVMTSSFYGNGGADGEDARQLFGDPYDLGPETDVDLLDEDVVGDSVSAGRSQILESVAVGCEAEIKKPQEELQEQEWNREIGAEKSVDAFGKIDEATWTKHHLLEESCTSMEEKGVCSEEEIEESQVKELEGGSGAEEAYDDSEEEEDDDDAAEWKYVSVKSGGGSVAVPEAAAVSSPETGPNDERAVSPAVHKVDVDSSASIAAEQSGDSEELLAVEKDLHYQESSGLEKGRETDENKFCQDLGFEVIQKVHVKEKLSLETDLLEKSFGEQSQEGKVQLIEGDFKAAREEEITELLDDSTMESRLNPDAAEFVPVSPTRNLVPESFSTVGREFDTFKKEAEACPGEIFEGVSMTPTKPLKKEEEPNFSNLIVCDDADVVLSSSFNCEIQQSTEIFERMSSDKDSFVWDPSTRAGDSENKENVGEFEDKENLQQHAKPEFFSVDEASSSHKESDERICGDGKSSQFTATVEDSFPVKISETVEMDKAILEGQLEKAHLEIYKLSTEAESCINEVSKTLTEQIIETVPAKEITEQVGKQTHHFPIDNLLDESIHSSEKDVLHETVLEKHSPILAEFQDHQSHLIHDEMLMQEVGQHSQASTPDQSNAYQMHKEVCVSLLEDANLCDFEEKVLEEQMDEVCKDPELHVDMQVDPLSILKENLVHHKDEHEEDIKMSQIENFLAHELDKQIQSVESSTSQNVGICPLDQVEAGQEEQIQSVESLTNQICPLEQEKDVQEEKQVQPVESLANKNVEICPLKPVEFRQEEQVQSVESLTNQNVKICSLKQVEFGQEEQNLPVERHENYCNVDEECPVTQVKSAHQETSVYPVESAEESYVGTDLTAIIPGSISSVEYIMEVECSSGHAISPDLIVDDHPLSDSSIILSSDTKSLTSHVDVASDIVKSIQAISLEETLPVTEDVSMFGQEELLTYVKTDTAVAAAELVLETVDKNQKLVDDSVIPPCESISSTEEVSAIELLAQTKEPNDVVNEKAIATDSDTQQTLTGNAGEVSGDAIAVGAVAATAALATCVATSNVTTSLVEAKPSTKKATAVEKKKMPEKGKLPPTSTIKGKTITKSPIPSRASSMPSKAPISSPTKVGGTLASSRPSPADRKSVASTAGKPLVSTKSNAAPLSSKPKPTGAKPSTIGTNRPAPPKTTTTVARTGIAATASSKSGLASTISKSSSLAPKSSTGPATHQKVAEVKRPLNGEATKSTSLHSTAPSRSAPRKTPLTSTTSASKPTSASKVSSSAKAAPVSHKTASEALSKSKASVTNAMNGTTSKPARASPASGSRPSAPLSARTKASTPTKISSPSTAGDPKKAKESANKHISATRATGSMSAARRSTDLKGNAASKTTSVDKGPVPVTRKPISNGTVIKKALENMDSKKNVDDKLVISPHANGISAEAGEVSKDEGSALEGTCEGKEQVILIVDEGRVVGEAV